MARRSLADSPDANFPIRVKIAVPPRGLGRMADEIEWWLRREVKAYGGGPAPALGMQAFAYHFLSLEDASRFLAAFPTLELAISDRSAPRPTVGSGW